MLNLIKKIPVTKLRRAAKKSGRLGKQASDRIDNSKGYERGNLALACLRCNAIKNNYFTKEEMLIIGKIIHDKIT